VEAAEDLVGFAFQPLYSLHTGGVVGVEALARPPRGRIEDLLRAAHRRGRLVDVDAALAARAVLADEAHESLLPLHLNLCALTAAAPHLVFDPLLAALGQSGRRPREIVLEIGAPFHAVSPKALLAGLQRFAELGFRIAFDGLGDLPLNLLTEAGADLVKLDRAFLRRLPGDPTAAALVESLVHFTTRTGVRLAASGVDDAAALTAVRQLGVRIVQGELLSPARTGAASSRPATAQSVLSTPRTATTAPRVDDFLHPATTLPHSATCDDVRRLLLDSEATTGVVGVDEQGRPRWTVDRARFLLELTGPFGHALRANKPAARFADPPRAIRFGAGAMELLDLVADADLIRRGDDIIVVGEKGECLGVVYVMEIVHAMAEAKIEEAAALNPLTRLPGSDAVAREVDRRISAGRPLVVAWLDVDSFKRVNDTAGFAAGDELIRSLGRVLSGLAAKLRSVTVSHVGGDDFLIACDIDEIPIVADALLGTPWSAEQVPVTVSLATVVCAGTAAKNYRDVSRLLAPLKKRAKNVRGSSWVNSWPGTDRFEILRGNGHDAFRRPHPPRMQPRHTAQ